MENLENNLHIPFLLNSPLLKQKFPKHLFQAKVTDNQSFQLQNNFPSKEKISPIYKINLP